MLGRRKARAANQEAAAYNATAGAGGANGSSYVDDTGVPAGAAGAGGMGSDYVQQPQSYDPANVGPDGVPVERKRNSAANRVAAIFAACWACTWPCHGPCCCGL
ncbi:unnamed protein product [Sphagnum troendelagicum]|uniref:Cysteine-rich transmembrane CYSTM domain-containing protein n=1 Tax=Sphagnum troendelagicum TaxID=128251 RepID=A0ABP0V2A2_9BRYO